MGLSPPGTTNEPDRLSLSEAEASSSCLDNSPLQKALSEVLIKLHAIHVRINKEASHPIVLEQLYLQPQPRQRVYTYERGGISYMLAIEIEAAGPTAIFQSRISNFRAVSLLWRLYHYLARPDGPRIKLTLPINPAALTEDDMQQWFRYLLSGFRRSLKPSPRRDESPLLAPAPENTPTPLEPVETGAVTGHTNAPDISEEITGQDLRVKGRAPLKMQIKVLRQKRGAIVEDICETENVSRTGAYFLSSQNYQVAELVEVFLPYREGDGGIPAYARVVRQDQTNARSRRGVAIRFEKGPPTRPSVGDASSGNTLF